uniref:Uncharacterized protein n=1 Tax=Solanum tuberosum TaxID=4113 RepID=M1DTV8_SOLTU
MSFEDECSQGADIVTPEKLNDGFRVKRQGKTPQGQTKGVLEEDPKTVLKSAHKVVTHDGESRPVGPPMHRGGGSWVMPAKLGSSTPPTKDQYVL